MSPWVRVDIATGDNEGPWHHSTSPPISGAFRADWLQSSLAVDMLVDMDHTERVSKYSIWIRVPLVLSCRRARLHVSIQAFPSWYDVSLFLINSCTLDTSICKRPLPRYLPCPTQFWGAPSASPRLLCLPRDRLWSKDRISSYTCPESRVFLCL